MTVEREKPVSREGRQRDPERTKLEILAVATQEFADRGFAGARVIAQTIREKLPEGFQRSEYLLAHGMLDMVVPRAELRATLSRLAHLLMKKPRPNRTATSRKTTSKPRPKA